MRAFIEHMITFSCDHPAAIGLLSMIWGVLAGWSARMGLGSPFGTKMQRKPRNG